MAAKRIVEEDNEAKEKTIYDKDLTIKTLMAKHLETQQKVNALEALVAIKDDLSDKLDLANQLIERLQVSKEKMQRELETASDYLLE